MVDKFDSLNDYVGELIHNKLLSAENVPIILAGIRKCRKYNSNHL